jgi:hypothetical protein
MAYLMQPDILDKAGHVRFVRVGHNRTDRTKPYGLSVVRCLPQARFKKEESPGKMV